MDWAVDTWVFVIGDDASGALNNECLELNKGRVDLRFWEWNFEEQYFVESINNLKHPLVPSMTPLVPRMETKPKLTLKGSGILEFIGMTIRLI
jgi:hypothetical protein